MPPQEPVRRSVASRQPLPRRRIPVDGTPSFSRTLPVAQPQIRPPVAVIPAPVEPLPLPVQPVATESERFAPPVKKRKLQFKKVARPQLTKLMLVPIVIVLLAALAAGAIKLQSSRNTADMVFNDALKNSLETQQLQAKTISGVTASTVQYDLSNSKSPRVSAESKVLVGGETAVLAGYGTLTDSYVSYKQMPQGTSSALVSSMQNSWVRLRDKGITSVGVPADLAKAGDPRYQLIGPVIFANFPTTTRNQLVKFLLGRNAYDYRSVPIKQAVVNGQKVAIYTMHPNIDALKTANQTAALSVGMAPTDVQEAVNELEQWRGATMTLAIAKSGHRPVQTTISKRGQTTTIDYSNFNNVNLPVEPETKLGWTSFANMEFQLEAQLATKQPTSQLDASRKSQLDALHTALATYYTQTLSYPTLNNLNDQSWIKANLIGVDPNALRDPLANSLTVLGSPRAGSFAYQSVPASGKGACDNTPAALCAHYKFMATQSNKQQYVVQDP